MRPDKSSKRFATGLVVGKFAPLHQGHLHVIERASALCDHVVLLSYCNPELPGCPPALRAHWLAACCPDTQRLVLDQSCLSAAGELPRNDAPDEVHRQFVGRVCIRVLARRVDAVFTSEDYGAGFAEALTACFAAAGFGRNPVRHVMVDRERRRVAVSATLLRNALWQHWHFLPAPVARSLVRRVVLLGGESTGKSTLAKALATHFATRCAPEFGRELWERQGGVLEYSDMRVIAREQIRREETAARSARGYVFCDTSPLTTLFYSHELFGRADPELKQAAARPYDLTVLCEADFPHVQDGTRSGPAFSGRQQRWYRETLRARGVQYMSVTGSLEQRVETSAARLRVATLASEARAVAPQIDYP